MAEPRPLMGQHALVTGGGRGIGFAIAKRLADLGASVTLAGRTTDRLEAAAATLSRCDVVQADVGDPAAVRRAFAALDERGHALTILINNAGVARSAKFAETDGALWEEMLRVNLTGVYHCIQAGLPRILAAGGGRIVTIASTAGLIGYPYVSAYCAAKHGVIGLMRTFAVELGAHSIRVNAVCPTNVNTPMFMNEGTMRLFRPDLENPGVEDFRPVAQFMHVLPIGWVEPVDISNAVLFLASDEARYITGLPMTVDAGSTLK